MYSSNIHALPPNSYLQFHYLPAPVLNTNINNLIRISHIGVKHTSTSTSDQSALFFANRPVNLRICFPQINTGIPNSPNAAVKAA